MIEFKNVSKKYGRKPCIKDVSFKINKGEIVGLLGLNGAGKSTIMNMLTGYIYPTEGEIFIEGINIVDNREKASKKIGYLPEIPPLYTDMTISETLKFVCDIRGVRDKKKSIDEILLKTGLHDVSNRMIGRLSKGYKQRVGLAVAMVGEPQILVLDEPTAGLDPKQITEIRELIKEIGKDKTVLVSSHILSEISQVCNRVIVIKEGQKVADGTAQELTDKTGNKIVLKTLNDAEEVIKGIDGVMSLDCNGTSYIIEAERDIRCELFYKLAEAKCPILELEYNDLENTFLRIINGVKE